MTSTGMMVTGTVLDSRKGVVSDFRILIPRIFHYMRNLVIPDILKKMYYLNIS